MHKNIFFTSDTHYNHKNICKGVSSWNNSRNEGNGQQTRDFSTLEEMNEAIVEGINNKVEENDILWHLGDWSFGGINSIWEFRKQIKCKHINLVFGNHDAHIENNKNFTLPKEDLEYAFHNFGIDHVEKGYLQDLFCSTQHVIELKEGMFSFFLSHYAHKVYNKSHKGNIHLYGHSHDTLDFQGGCCIPYGKTMDVGIDSAYRILGKYEPFSLQEIIEIMNKRQPKLVDHHNSLTN